MSRTQAARRHRHRHGDHAAAGRRRLGGGIAEVERSTDITHLGEGLTATGRLSDAAMRRVADVIARYARTHRASSASSASPRSRRALARDAENGAEFLALLAARGVVPEIIPGEREARLSFAGATSDVSDAEGLLVVDLGGGSTELILGDVAQTRTASACPRSCSARSIDVGSKRVTELFLHSDPPTPSELAEAREWATTQLRPYFDGLRDRPREMVARRGNGDESLGDPPGAGGLRLRARARLAASAARNSPTSPRCSRR